MKKLIITLVSVCSLSFIACEEESPVTDFISRREIETIITGEEIDFQTPIIIGNVRSSPFTAIEYFATVNGNQMEIFFENEEGDTLILTVFNPTSDTFTAGINSQNLFVGQIRFEETGEFFTTSQEETQDAIGSLQLEINNEDQTVSGTFDFTAFSPSQSIFTEVSSGNFDNIPIR